MLKSNTIQTVLALLQFDISPILALKVSIIIPTKNQSNLLKTCIDSIYEKTNYTNFEIIIVSNNSTEKPFFPFGELQEDIWRQIPLL